MNWKERQRWKATLKKNYDYLSNIPHKGWVWEFARRTKEYKEAIDYFAAQERLGDSDEEREGYFLHIDEIMNLGLSFTEVDPEFKDERFVINRFQDDKLHVWVHLHYRVPYSALTAGELKTFLNPPFQVVVGKEEIEDGFTAHSLNRGEFTVLKHPEFPLPDGVVDYGSLVSRLLACPWEHYTVFVGISKKAGEQDLRDLVKAVRPYLQGKRIKRRDDKWKLYLIVYDLHEKERLTFDDISDILQETYGGNQTERDVERHYKEAATLIDKKKYKKYLMIS